MSTINPANPATPSYPATTVPATEGGTVSAPRPVETGRDVTETAPLYRSFLPSPSPGDIAGLSMPQNVEDTAILLAKVVAELEAGRGASLNASLAGAGASERQEVAAELSKITEARTALYGDSDGGAGLVKQRSDAGAARDTAQKSKSSAEKALSAEEKTKSGFENRLKDAETRSTDKTLSDQKRADAKAEATKLKADIAASESKLSKLNENISTLEGSISKLDKTISGLDDRISSATQRLELGESSLAFASARLVAARADARSDQDLEIAQDDQALAHILKTSQEEIRDLRERIVARFEETHRTSEDLTKALENDRILATVVGLVTALADTTETVRREAGATQNDVARVQAGRLEV